jgi:hypothetical protein
MIACNNFILKANPVFIPSKVPITLFKNCLSNSIKAVDNKRFLSTKNLNEDPFISFPFGQTNGSTHALNQLIKILEHICTTNLILLKYFNTSTHIPCCANLLIKEFHIVGYGEISSFSLHG